MEGEGAGAEAEAEAEAEAREQGPLFRVSLPGRGGDG